MTQFHLAQMNIAQGKALMDSAEMSEFVALLDEINQLADEAPGFIWRLQDANGSAVSICAFNDPKVLVNMSVWQDQQSLFNYVYKTAHSKVMSRRKEWFDHMKDAYQVLWWIDAGTIPTVEEAKVRLNSLRENGPTTFAFNFKNTFPQPAAA